MSSACRCFDVDEFADDVEGCADVGFGAWGGGEDGSLVETVEEAIAAGTMASVVVVMVVGSATAEAGAVSTGGATRLRLEQFRLARATP